jgi:hypothetical protein
MVLFVCLLTVGIIWLALAALHHWVRRTTAAAPIVRASFAN